MPPDLLPGLFWLLLPVAAASGWYAARRRGQAAQDRDQALSGRLSLDYLRGLNYLFNEQPDKAIDVFIKMLEVEADTVETHLALGNLFRRRGEVDRAIRIHQNLIAKSTLSANQRGLAVLELGMDYMRSGLLDRAEGLFKELLDLDMHTRQALKQLVEIYQQEQDWEKAIGCADRLQTSAGVEMGSLMAQFLCEQAQESLRQGDVERVQRLVERALNVDSRCVRASLLEGGIARAQGRWREAVRIYRRIESQDAEYLPEALGPLLDCYRALEATGEFCGYLHYLSERYAGITPVLMLAELERESRGVPAAIDYLSEELRRRPSVRGLDRLIEYSLLRADEHARNNFNMLKEFTSKLLENRPVYRCGQCGFRGKSLHWQCPGCKAWTTVKPIHGIEGE